MLHPRYFTDFTEKMELSRDYLNWHSFPYVGCRVFASSACMDKIFAKKVFESAGIPQVKSVYVKKRNDGKTGRCRKDMEETEEVEASIMKELGMPCFIKASRSDPGGLLSL